MSNQSPGTLNTGPLPLLSHPHHTVHLDGPWGVCHVHVFLDRAAQISVEGTETGDVTDAHERFIILFKVILINIMLVQFRRLEGNRNQYGPG